MQNNSAIVLHQILYGYSDGHTKLASSITGLSRETEKKLLVLSDLPGLSSKTLFDHYYTAFPLNKDKLYVVSKTWYANELKRPGCVWTHSILIKYKDLSTIIDIRNIIKLFKRPKSINLLNTYRRPIKFNNKLTTHQDGRKIEKIGYHIIDILYSVNKPIYLSTNNPQKYEELIFLLWNAQWKSLKTSFSFCSNSISDRSLDSKSFDLQIVDKKLMRSINRQNPNGYFISDNELYKPNYSQNSIIYEYIFKNQEVKNNDITLFINMMGDTIKAKRTDYFILMELYNLINKINSGSSGLNDLLSYVNKKYRNSLRGKNVVSTILSSKKPNFINISDYDYLKELSTSDHHKMFKDIELGITKRVESLWIQGNKNDKRKIVRIIKISNNPVSNDILTGITNVIKPDELITLVSTDFEIVILIIKQNPSFAIHEYYWHLPINFQKELLYCLSISKKRGKNFKNQLLQKLILGSGSGIAVYYNNYFGDVPLTDVLALYNNNETIDNDRIQEWINVSNANKDQFIAWLSKGTPNLKTAILISRNLSKYKNEIQWFEYNVWDRIIDNLLIKNSREDLSEIYMFILPVAMTQDDEFALKIIAQSYNIIYTMLLENKLDYDVWIDLEKFLPKVPFWKMWDKCERYRRWLIIKIVNANWDFTDFQRLLHNNVIKSLIATSETMEGYKKFYRRSRNNVSI